MTVASSSANSADSRRSRSTGPHARTAGSALVSAGLFPPHTGWHLQSRRAARSDRPLDCGSFYSTRLSGALQQALASGIRRPNPRLQTFGVLLCADPAARYLQRPRGTARRGIIDEDCQSYTCCSLGDAYSPERCVSSPRLQAPRGRGLGQGDTAHRSPARLLAA